MSENKIFYCYIAHKKIIDYYIPIIQQTMNKLSYDNYSIFYGSNRVSVNNKVISLQCDDTYEGLPNKIHNICKFVSENNQNFTHFCKLDCNIVLKKLFPVLDYDYYGYCETPINVLEHRRRYHFGKCSINSEWNYKIYQGSFIKYCWGGVGYVLSKKSVDCIASSPNNPKYDIYEDLYVAQKLFDHLNITPQFLHTAPFIDKY